MSELNLSLKLALNAEQLLAPLKEVAASLSNFSRQAREQLGRVDAFKGLQSGLVSTATALDAAKVKLRDVSQQLIAANDPAAVQQAKAGYAEALREVNALTRALEKQESQLKKLGGELDAAGVDTRRLSQEQQRLQAVVQNFDVAAATLRQPARINSPAIGGTAGGPPAGAAGTSANGNGAAINIPLMPGIVAQSGLARELQEIDAGIKKITASAPGMGQALASSTRPVRGGVEGIRDQLNRLQTAVAGFYATVATFRGVGSLIQIADSYALVQARIRQASETEQEYAQGSRAVFAIAQETRAPLEAVGNLYARLAPALREQGKSQSELASMVRLTSQAMAVGGATTQESEGAIRQFSQAMASGTLRGDEFNSVNEQSPRLMKALADGLGVSRGELRKFADEGKLTTEFVTRALATQAKVIDEEFKRLPVTVSGSLQVLKNEFQRGLGELNQSTGVTSGLSQLILALARNLSTVLGVAFAVAAAAAANWVMSLARGVGATNAANAANNQARLALIARAEAAMAAAAAQNIKAQADLRAAQAAGAAAAADGRLVLAQASATAAAANMAAAQTTVAAATATAAARVGLASRLMGALGGPVGIAITALTALAGWWLTVGQNAESAGDKQAKAFAEISGKSIQTLKSGGSFSDDDIKELYAQVNTLRDAYRDAAKARDIALGRTNGTLGQRRMSPETVGLPEKQESAERAENALNIAEQLLERAKARRVEAAVEQEKLKREFSSFTGSTDSVSDTASVSSREQTIKARYEKEEQIQKLSLDRQAITESTFLADSKARLEREIQERVTLREVAILKLESAKPAAGNADKIATLRNEIEALNNEREEGLAQITIREEQIEREFQQKRFQLQVEYLDKSGRATEAAAIKARQAVANQLRDLGAVESAKVIETEIKQTLTTLGADISNANLGGKLVEISDVESALTLAETRIKEAQTRLSTRREGIQTSVQTGGISETQGEALNNQASREFVDQIAPEVKRAQEELNAATVDPAVRQSLQERIDQLQQLLTGTRAQIGPTTEWGVTLKNIGDQVQNRMADGLADAFVQVADGSKTAKEAFRDFARSTLSLIAQMIVRALVLKAIQAALNGYSGGGEVTTTSSPSPSAGGDGSLMARTGGFISPDGVRLATGGRMDLIPGGTVRGPGTGTSDSIPAWLSNGEYVIKADSVRKVGTDVLEQINQGKLTQRVKQSSFMDSLRSFTSRSSEKSVSDKAVRLATGGRADMTPGGTVRGPGTGTSDSIPAWLSKGEYVIKAESVRKVGTRMLDALNGGNLPRPMAMRAVAEKAFATGGLVGDEPQTGSGSTSTLAGRVIVNIENNGPPMQAQKTGQRQDGLDTIVDLIVEKAQGRVAQDVRTGGPVRNSMQSTFGLNPAFGATR